MRLPDRRHSLKWSFDAPNYGFQRHPPSRFHGRPFKNVAAELARQLNCIAALARGEIMSRLSVSYERTPHMSLSDSSSSSSSPCPRLPDLSEEEQEKIRQLVADLLATRKTAGQHRQKANLQGDATLVGDTSLFFSKSNPATTPPVPAPTQTTPNELPLRSEATTSPSSAPAGGRLSVIYNRTRHGETIASGRAPYHLLGQLSRQQLAYSMSGLRAGMFSMVGGIILFLAGVSGSMTWIAKFVGAESRIINAAPGAVLFIVGLFVVCLTRYHVSIKE